MHYEMSFEEVRILGSLIEKQITTPDYYPLTLNSLINACNQKSNRKPVVFFDERRTLRVIDSLREREFLTVFRGADSRVPKFMQKFTEKLELNPQATAVMCILMLRGVQTSGEIRSRTGRLYPFQSLDEVEMTLKELAEREKGPLVVYLPRQPGQKEGRYSHLLSGKPEIPKVRDANIDFKFAQDEREKIAALEEDVNLLRLEMQALKKEFLEFKEQFE